MWGLLQLTDSTFPTGAFTHSYGMESLVQENKINDLKSAEEWLRICITNGWAQTDGLASILTWEVVNGAETTKVRNALLLEQLSEIDMTLSASRPAEEARHASNSTGKRLLKEVAGIHKWPILCDYQEWIKDHPLSRHLGNFAVIYGMIGAEIGWSVDLTGLASGYATSAGLVATLIKLVPLGQSEGQYLLSQLPEPISIALHDQRGKNLGELGASLPFWDIAQMRHESLYSRLFRS